MILQSMIPTHIIITEESLLLASQLLDPCVTQLSTALRLSQ